MPSINNFGTALLHGDLVGAECYGVTQCWPIELAIRSAAHKIPEGIRAIGTGVDAASLVKKMASASAGDIDLDELHPIAIISTTTMQQGNLGRWSCSIWRSATIRRTPMTRWSAASRRPDTLGRGRDCHGRREGSNDEQKYCDFPAHD